jgi:RNA polymerase sigma-70 factor (ECF subfamily)
MTAPAHRQARHAAAEQFETHRRFVWGLAYRITGSPVEADDIVQETFLRALQHQPEARADGWRGWLARVASNLSIDALRRRKRRDYTGQWLPGVIETGDDASPPGYEIVSNELTTEHRYDLMESVSMAFMLALERLTPRQRAVLILRDVFDYTVQEAAAALQLTATNVKVTHHRARAAMEQYEGCRVVPTRAHQQAAGQKLAEFITHLQNKDVRAVEAMLADDVRFIGDGGGEYPSALNVVSGRDAVARLLFGLGAKQTVLRSALRMINGEPAVLAEPEPKPGFAPRFVFRIDLDAEGRIREIHTIAANEKLAALRFDLDSGATAT